MDSEEWSVDGPEWGSDISWNIISVTLTETRLKHAQNETHADHLLPVCQEAEADHRRAPEECDRREENTRPEFAEDDGRRWLQENVGREEDERNNRVAIPDQF